MSSQPAGYPRQTSTLSRRNMLQAGVIGTMGLSMTDVCASRSQAARSGDGSPASPKAVIYLFMTGGPSQHDTFDMKPDGPAEYKGEFSPIQSRTPGTDICEHMPMLAQPSVADFYQMFGQSALHATGMQRTHLERLHWFTIEFGLIRQAEGLRVFGAGIMSSKEEALHALSDEVEVIPFSLETVIQQEYEVWNLQPTLFALDSFDQLVDEFRFWSSKQGLAA